MLRAVRENLQNRHRRKHSRRTRDRRGACSCPHVQMESGLFVRPRSAAEPRIQLTHVDGRRSRKPAGARAGRAVTWDPCGGSRPPGWSQVRTPCWEPSRRGHTQHEDQVDVARDILTGAFSGSSSLHGHTWGARAVTATPVRFLAKRGRYGLSPSGTETHTFSASMNVSGRG